MVIFNSYFDNQRVQSNTVDVSQFQARIEELQILRFRYWEHI